MPLEPAWLPQASAWLSWAAAAAFAGALTAGLVGRPAGSCLAPALGLAGGLACAACVGLVIWFTARAPLLGALEAISQVALLLAGLALADWLRGGAGRAAARWAWGGCLALTVLMAALPAAPNHDSFMYDYPALVLFFQLRLVCMGLLLFAAARCLASARGGRAGGAGWVRRPLLAGMAAFLASELSGAVWSFQWTGEFWHWNRGFLESAAMFMVIALPLHLPPRWAARPGWRLAAGVLPGVVVTAVTLIRHLGEA
jgi:hypothetical protein